MQLTVASIQQKWEVVWVAVNLPQHEAHGELPYTESIVFDGNGNGNSQETEVVKFDFLEFHISEIRT